MIAGIQLDNIAIEAGPEEPQLHYGESEFDLLMTSCSAVYCERIMLQRLISSVRIASYYEDDNPLDAETESPRNVAVINIKERHTAITAEEVSRKFGVGLDTARKMLKAMTQNGIRHAIHPLSRRYRTDIMQSK